MTTCLTFVLALNRAGLNSFPPAIVCRQTPSVDVLMAYDSIMENTMLNSVGACIGVRAIIHLGGGRPSFARMDSVGGGGG